MIAHAIIDFFTAAKAARALPKFFTLGISRHFWLLLGTTTPQADPGRFLPSFFCGIPLLKPARMTASCDDFVLK